MPWFRRRSRRDRTPADADPTASAPDPYLPPLTRADAAHLTELSVQAFAEVGITVTPDGRGALIGEAETEEPDARSSYGLSNLAARAAGIPVPEWPELVSEFVARVSTVLEAPQDLDSVREQVLLRLRPTAAFDGMPVPEYAPELLPGIIAVVAVDYPTHVHELLSDQDLEPLGVWPELRKLALDNLRRLPAPEHTVVPADEDRADSEVHLFGADDFFGASRLLILPELLASVGIERPSHGVVFVIPNRHLLAVHVLSGPGVVSAMTLLTKLAIGESQGQAGALSSAVFYRSADGEVQQISRLDAEDQQVAIEVTGPMAEAFAELGLIGEE